MWRRTAAAALLAVTAAACGGRRPPPVATPPPAWQANARQVVEQLRADVAAAAIGGTTRAEASKALADVSDLYGLLVVYSDLGGCRRMVGATGAPPGVVATLGAACVHLQRAAGLFARAARAEDAAALARATHEVSLAEPALVRAMLAVRAHPGTRGEK